MFINCLLTILKNNYEVVTKLVNNLSNSDFEKYIFKVITLHILRDLLEFIHPAVVTSLGVSP